MEYSNLHNYIITVRPSMTNGLLTNNTMLAKSHRPCVLLLLCLTLSRLMFPFISLSGLRHCHVPFTFRNFFQRRSHSLLHFFVFIKTMSVLIVKSTLAQYCPKGHQLRSHRQILQRFPSTKVLRQ